MANFKNVTSTVCGAASGLNDVLNGIDDFGDELLKALEEGPAKLASEVVGDTKEKLDNAESFLENLVPKIPTLKDLGLQDEVFALQLLVGDAIAYAEKVASIAAAFGELDFEKIMLATCDADNLKIDSKGRLVKIAKNVTIQEGSGTIEAYIKTLPSLSLDNLTISGALADAQKIVDEVEDGITLVKDLEKEISDIGKDTIKKGFTLIKDFGSDTLEINVTEDDK